LGLFQKKGGGGGKQRVKRSDDRTAVAFRGFDVELPESLGQATNVGIASLTK